SERWLIRSSTRRRSKQGLVGATTVFGGGVESSDRSTA
ncbi:hypothetical protein A2U01_0089915, partial [Trifolium medium]|nr:hypothetical protein [Trifolium medium]